MKGINCADFSVKSAIFVFIRQTKCEWLIGVTVELHPFEIDSNSILFYRNEKHFPFECDAK